MFLKPWSAMKEARPSVLPAVFHHVTIKWHSEEYEVTGSEHTCQEWAGICRLNLCAGDVEVGRRYHVSICFKAHKTGYMQIAPNFYFKREKKK